MTRSQEATLAPNLADPFLTTVTPYWGRPDILRLWLKALKGATTPEVRHILYLVEDRLPHWWDTVAPPNMIPILSEDRGCSIGHFHNMGIMAAQSPWVMKLDVDALPNVRYFKELLPLLRSAGPREWFNGGMFFINQSASLRYLSNMPLDEKTYLLLEVGIHHYSASPSLCPEASNFICRRSDYLFLGGCDTRFKGWGWEDYQQIYMLERYQQGKDPLPGQLGFENVTQRCRDEISRPKAKALYARNRFLTLLHHWHPRSTDPTYRNPSQVERNRHVLLNYITSQRR